MTWIVQDKASVKETAISPIEISNSAQTSTAPSQKRSNAKRKKMASSAVQESSHDNNGPDDENGENSSIITGTAVEQAEVKKEPSKSQRKRARHEIARPLNEDEKNWNRISLFDVPALPAASEIDPIINKPVASSSKKKNQHDQNKTATTNIKKQDQPRKNSKDLKNKGSKKSKQGGQFVTADYGKLDDWGWTPVDTEGMFMDDTEGFLCLEELDGVEVDYQGTEETGRTIVFKHDPKKAAAGKGKSVRHSEPLNVGDNEIYYDIDTFDEDLLMHQKGQEIQNVDTAMNEPETEQHLKTDSNLDVCSKPSKPESKAESVKEKKGQKKDANDPKAVEKETDGPIRTGQNGLADTSIAKNTEHSGDEGQKKLDRKEKQRLKVEALKARQAAKKAAKATLKAQEEPKAPFDPMEGVDTSFDISAWMDYNFSSMIQNALKKQKFANPSPIQQKALPLGLAGRDVIGVAETGSGKTLAFGLPIIQYLAEQATSAVGNNTPLQESLTALILTPTRELAIQVKDHLVAFTQFTGHHVVPIVGGMSIQKQVRQLDRNPAIIVATPGRLWELISTNTVYSDRLIHTRFLVLDEADRMLESGHFQELSNILKLLERKRERTSDWEQHAVTDEGSQDNTNGVVVSKTVAQTDYEHNRQTFIFTATLSKELSLNLSKKKNQAKSAEQSGEGTMEDLMNRIEFHDESPALVNIVTDKIVASTLLEAKIDCLTTEKDLYLYYFATKYPGRTLVFVNSIDAIRHLAPMMQLLGIEALGMHAQMQQRQRLKNLERFKANSHAMMIASDVAARGLDIPMVDHVIHYQVPRSGDIYVHRSGRTARAQNEGISLLICGPDEAQLYRKICVTLKKDNGIVDFPIDRSVINEMKKRVALAKKIDEQEHRIQKAAHQDDWMLKSAEAMDIIVDEDMLNAGPKSKDKEEDNSAMTARKNNLKAMRAELKAMLQKRIMPMGASAKYITSGSIRDLADRLRDSAHHNPLMPAHIKSTALEDIKTRPCRNKQTQAKTH
ncbi:ATP-dependent RNA helicase [Lobosporangium transversale]|uniref:p-loop containing nucleoside triphosphate hydrolase protein n=1 Tax=Lobosporangium transversale TaxID=64571 RepID=A0A1Y2H445_9FUNG|nr:P-loop containing nucleoside triphosphate hydrolase protein [Lobosporangium transversale]KAF9910976.1 ATP-dependent RNA helicase [Lobosporangium transversale]ORZ27832.1 P-loop containing nucleoside triphosphate hydrolase protein [Lobosporangium transversale]|eukprot:XP_021885535.1 P-loop containing nucleoside triphosphate hydrolase protein [Lobosporangium transversale]